ncbi:MAG: 2-amino-4-hydroxy-6-hydroxymethyldihydropteridine diphosphokinase [Marinosulfonomonas sp.]
MKPVQKYMSKNILLGLGGNIGSEMGPPVETIRSAIPDVAACGLNVAAVSRYYQTPCFPVGAGPDYVNAALRCESELEPIEILARLREIEASYGRERRERWGSRTLDIDVLAVDDVVLPDRETYLSWAQLDQGAQKQRTPQDLILPHPRLQDRGFVLIPMADIAPDWVHPILKKTVTEMLDELPIEEKSDIRVINTP